MGVKSVSFILFLILLLCGCSEVDLGDSVGGTREKNARDLLRGARRDAVKVAYERARASMLREKKVQADVLWVLQQFVDSDAELKQFIAESKISVSNPHFVPGVFPDLPRLELPEHPDREIRKFILYLQAAFGCPQERALSWLQDFIATEEDGYVLTHQFLCLIWAEQAGLPLAENIQSRRQEIWQSIYKEQCCTVGVDSIDLYMERMAIVLMYGHSGDVDQAVVDTWVAQVIDLQLGSGSWPLSRTLITYDGASTVVSSPRSHTTALAMMALHAYMYKW